MAFEQATDWLTAAQHTLASISLPSATGEVPSGAETIQWGELGKTETAVPPNSLASAESEMLQLRMELGRARLDREAAVRLRKGSIVPLDMEADALVEIYAGDRRIARAEPLMLDGHLAFRVVELSGQKEVRQCR